MLQLNILQIFLNKGGARLLLMEFSRRHEVFPIIDKFLSFSLIVFCLIALSFDILDSPHFIELNGILIDKIQPALLRYI
jgi:hypothetical protein